MKKGQKHSQVTKNKMRDIKLKNPTKYWLGKTFTTSEETKQKLREASLRNGNKPPTKSGVGSPFWKGGKAVCVACKKQLNYYGENKKCLLCTKQSIRESIICPCGVVFVKYKRVLKKFCSKKCIAYIENSIRHRWIIDRSQLKTDRQKMYDTRYKYWMLEVKKRDNWKCKIANMDCKGTLEAHHILRWSDYPELRYEINNGITLCHAHHPRKVAEEKRLVPTFQELVSVSN